MHVDPDVGNLIAQLAAVSGLRRREVVRVALLAAVRGGVFGRPANWPELSRTHVGAAIEAANLAAPSENVKSGRRRPTVRL